MRINALNNGPRPFFLRAGILIPFKIWTLILRILPIRYGQYRTLRMHLQTHLGTEQIDTYEQSVASLDSKCVFVEWA